MRNHLHLLMKRRKSWKYVKNFVGRNEWFTNLGPWSGSSIRVSRGIKPWEEWVYAEVSGEYQIPYARGLNQLIFYTTSIKYHQFERLAFHLARVKILGTNYDGKKQNWWINRQTSEKYVKTRKWIKEKLIKHLETTIKQNNTVTINQCKLKVFLFNMFLIKNMV